MKQEDMCEYLRRQANLKLLEIKDSDIRILILNNAAMQWIKVCMQVVLFLQ